MVTVRVGVQCKASHGPYHYHSERNRVVPKEVRARILIRAKIMMLELGLGCWS